MYINAKLFIVMLMYAVVGVTSILMEILDCLLDYFEHKKVAKGEKIVTLYEGIYNKAVDDVIEVIEEELNENSDYYIDDAYIEEKRVVLLKKLERLKGLKEGEKNG